MVIISMILEKNNDQIMTIMTSHYYNDQVATCTLVGKLSDMKLHINRSVQPVIQPARRIPFHLRKPVEEKLQDLLYISGHQSLNLSRIQQHG